MRVEQYLMGMQKLGILTLEDAFVGHAACDMTDQNCTTAIRLKTITLQAGKTIENVEQAALEAETIPVMPADIPAIPLPTIQVGGHTITLPMEVLSDVTRQCVQDAKSYVDGCNSILVSYGRSLAKSALHPNVELVALELPIGLLHHRVMCSRDGRTYLFYLPVAYKPAVISIGSQIFQLDAADASNLARDVLLRVTLTESLKFYHMMLVKDDGSKFHHYHSRPSSRGGLGEDCWGSIKPLDYYHTPNLVTLLQLASISQKTLATINKDSIFDSHPPGMPTVGELQERATLVDAMTVAHPADGVRLVPVAREEVRAWRV